MVFIDIGGYGSDVQDYPYLCHYPDSCLMLVFTIFLCPNILFSCLNNFDAIYCHNKIRKYDILLDRNWVTKNSRFIIGDAADLGKGITDTNLLSFHDISGVNRGKESTNRQYTFSKLFDCYKIIFSSDCSTPYLNLTPIVINYSTCAIRPK